MSKLIIGTYSYSYIPLSYVKIALHDLTLIGMIVARLVDTGSFLIRYSNGHTK
jgi:hypothetical protein